MTKEEIAAVLALHKAWLLDRETGVRANLSGADLSSADLRGANLSGADLSRADLSGADLSRADLSGADLRGADLRWANLSGADLRGADLSRADLSGADLSGADLSRADLSGADLRGADLRWANLSGADLRGADLSRADLRGANLDFSCLPLWCGSLTAHFDDRQLIQFAYVRSGKGYASVRLCFAVNCTCTRRLCKNVKRLGKPDTNTFRAVERVQFDHRKRPYGSSPPCGQDVKRRFVLSYSIR